MKNYLFFIIGLVSGSLLLKKIKKIKVIRKKITDYYKLPITPNEIFKNTDTNMPDETRYMRLQMIKMLINLSSEYSQKEIDNSLYVDIEDGEIIGFDMSKLLKIYLNKNSEDNSSI